MRAGPSIPSHEPPFRNTLNVIWIWCWDWRSFWHLRCSKLVVGAKCHWRVNFSAASLIVVGLFWGHPLPKSPRWLHFKKNFGHFSVLWLQSKVAACKWQKIANPALMTKGGSCVTLTDLFKEKEPVRARHCTFTWCTFLICKSFAVACLEVSQEKLVARTTAKTECHQKHPKGGGTSMNECCLKFTAKR